MSAIAAFVLGAALGSQLAFMVTRHRPSAGDKLHSEIKDWILKMRTMKRFSGSTMVGEGVARLPECGRFKITIEPISEHEPV